MLTEGDESPEKIVYQAASPDEAALVLAAKNFGFFFFRLETFATIYGCIGELPVNLSLVTTHQPLCHGTRCSHVILLAICLV